MYSFYRYNVIIFITALLVFTGCGGKSHNDLDQLAAWMTGSFSSEDQSLADTNFFDIRLEMTPIWLERTDGHWFYVEQAVGTHLDIPYRQRIYHLAQMGENRFSSDIFTFPNPDLYIGKWAVPETFSSLTPDSLLSRDGCTVFITRQDEKTFSGSTEGKNCASSLGDAAYATSQVTITKDYILSWDRGFDSNDMQAWGAVTGGYLFNRIKSY